jgi:hypothetical protein
MHVGVEAKLNVFQIPEPGGKLKEQRAPHQIVTTRKSLTRWEVNKNSTNEIRKLAHIQCQTTSNLVSLKVQH